MGERRAATGMGGLAALLAAAIALTAPSPAAACSCVRFAPGEALRSATHVFAGTAVATRPARGRRREAVTAFRVDARVKGRVPRRAAVVAALDGPSCGYRFRVGRRYLVFARRDGAGRLRTNLCAGTREARRAGGAARGGCAAAAGSGA